MEITNFQRKEDIIIKFAHNKMTKEFNVIYFNQQARDFLSYKDYTNLSLLKIIPEDLVNELISNQIDENDDTIILTIFQHCKNFYLITQDGKKINVSMKIYPSFSEEKSIIIYDLLIKEWTIAYKLYHFRINEKNIHLNTLSINILDHESILNILKIIKEYTSIHKTETINITIIFFSLQNKKDQSLLDLLDEIKEDNLRDSDIIGILNDNLCIILLMDCATDSILNVLSRIKSNFIEKNIEISNENYLLVNNNKDNIKQYIDEYTGLDI
ncbi:MAG: hypothetical protein OEY79_02380 [Anaplasmataceae bacterium]|nr:hypothetical protein [Anaplasmataceae bacterium]